MSAERLAGREWPPEPREGPKRLAEARIQPRMGAAPQTRREIPRDARTGLSVRRAWRPGAFYALGWAFLFILSAILTFFAQEHRPFNEPPFVGSPVPSAVLVGLTIFAALALFVLATGLILVPDIRQVSKPISTLSAKGMTRRKTM